MKQITLLISITIAAILAGCKNEPAKQDNFNDKAQTEVVRINPLDQLKQVDKLLSEIAEEPQRLNAPSNKATKVTGKKGTIIHVDPTDLETVDGSSLGSSIQIELLEITDKSNLLLNNAQTASNGRILVTGGAYYLNMNSDGKQLKMKQGKGLKVEFPKLTKNEMKLFLGERDSLGQINWISTDRDFETEIVSDTIISRRILPSTLRKADIYLIDSINARISIIPKDHDYLIDSIDAPKTINKEDVTEEEYEEYQREVKEYKKRKKEVEYQRQTYKAVELMNFGWINCDRFYEDPKPKTDIQLTVNNDSLQGARFFAIFKDIKSVITEYYWKGQKEDVVFKDIPIGKVLTIIALSAKDDTPFIFEKTINTETDRQVQVNFEVTTQTKIQEKMKKMN